jgi:hypothetical protein
MDDWIYCTLYIHATRDYRQYSTIAYLHNFNFAVPHAIGFSAFTSRILAMASSQSRCNFISQVESSCDSLIPYLPFLLSHLRLPSPELSPVPFLLLFRTACYSASTSPVLSSTFYNHFARTARKTSSSIMQNECLLVRHLAVDVLLLLGALVAGMHLPPRCLAMGIHLTILSCLLAG